MVNIRLSSYFLWLRSLAPNCIPSSGTFSCLGFDVKGKNMSSPGLKILYNVPAGPIKLLKRELLRERYSALARCYKYAYCIPSEGDRTRAAFF